MPVETEAYNQFVEAIVDFLKAKRDEAIRRGNMPSLDQVIAELEDSKYTK